MTTLAEVYDDIREDPAFKHFREAGLTVVPGEGAARPDIFIVGEAPGATEDVYKRPFVGPTGLVIRSLINDCAELPEDAYFITNVLKYFPHSGRRVRTPDRVEVSDSLPHLRNEYRALGSPKIFVAVGGIALSALRPDLTGITQWAGKRAAMSSGAVLFPMLHPAYILRQRNLHNKEGLKAKAERDWAELGRWYREEFVR